MNSDEDIEHALHRWLAGHVPDHYVTQVFGPHMLQRWQAMLVSIVEESEIPIVHDETPLPPRPWSTNMHPTRYIDGIANQEDGLSQSINRFRQHTVRAKLLHQSRLRPLEMEYQHSIGMTHLADAEVLPGRRAQAAATITHSPKTIAPATTAQEHASQFLRRYPSRQAPPLDHATGMILQSNDEDNPVRDLQTWHTGTFPHIPVPPDRRVPHHGELPSPDRSRSPLRNPGVHTRGTMATSLQQIYDSLGQEVDPQLTSQHHDHGHLLPVLPVDQLEPGQAPWWRRPIKPELLHMLPQVEPHHWELQEDGTPVIRYYPNRMNFLPKQLVHKFPSITQEAQRSVLMSWTNISMTRPLTYR